MSVVVGAAGLREFSSVDILFIVNELQCLLGGRVDKAYQPAADELLITLHVTSIGKKILNIFLPGCLFVSELKKDQPETPSGFCMSLRKRLSGTRIRKVCQHASERVVELFFEGKDGFLILIVELFSTGNVILCDSEYRIIRPLRVQRWKDREVRAGAVYKHPSKGFNLFSLSAHEFSAILKGSKRESVVKALAMDLGLGGVYAEEICALSGIDKNKKTLSEKELIHIHSSFALMISKKPSPVVVKANNCIVDVLPFSFASKKNQVPVASMNEVFTSLFFSSVRNDALSKRTSKYDKAIDELVRIIRTQEKAIAGMAVSAEENTAKGELLYSNYTAVEAILRDLKKASKQLSWTEIKCRLKDHRIVRMINEKEGSILLEL